MSVPASTIASICAASHVILSGSATAVSYVACSSAVGASSAASFASTAAQVAAAAFRRCSSCRFCAKAAQRRGTSF